MTAEESWVDARGLRFHHLRWTGGPGTPIVCLHGVTGQAWAWSGAGPLLATSADVFALDLRGHGDSDWAPDGDYSTATLADDVAAVVEALGIGPVDVVGLSWGGLVATTLAAHRHDLVRRLVVVDVPATFDVPVDAVPVRPESFASLAEVVAYERAANAHAPDEVVAALAAGSVRPRHGGHVRRHDPIFFTRWAFRAEDHRPAFEAVTCPSLVVRATDSPVLSADAARAEADLLGAELIELGPSGHLVPVDAPAAFAAAVLDFLA
ncbi:MAG: hypothetical protein JWN29_3891 [Acidimicrobiales bacterium]|nr:hypothetical protein [Acidimicrobiales bacterium]